MTPQRYRKKPVEVEAVQWTGDNIAEVAKLLQIDLTVDLDSSDTNPQDHLLYATDNRPPALVMKTVHGETAVARVDDWVVPEPVPGRGYPVRADIFAATYEPVRVSPNSGHGHVRERPDGLKARCGGPGICSACSRDAAQEART